MLALKQYLSNIQAGVCDINSLQPVLLAPGTYCPPHAGHKRMFEHFAAKAQSLNVKPIIVVVDTRVVERHRPLTGAQRKYWISKVDFHQSPIIIGENAHEIVHALLHKAKVVPVGDVLGESSNNAFFNAMEKLVGKDHPATVRYVSYTVTAKQGSLLYEQQMPSTHQLSSTYIREIVEADNKQLFETVYKNIGLKTDEIRTLYDQIRKGLVVGDVNMLARGRVS